MTCDQAKEQLILQAYDELGEADRAELQLHLPGCPECETEVAALNVFAEQLSVELLPDVSPNLLAGSRMRLDEALDGAGGMTWANRLGNFLAGTWRHLYAAPALATLLVSIGFLSGNLLARYQLSQVRARPMPPQIGFTNEAESTIGNVSGVYAVPGSDTVQVKYNRIVPTVFQGSVDAPQVRQLLMLGAQKGADNEVRATSVGYLVDECLAGHHCEHASAGESTGLRDTLLVSLRYDKSAAVRLRALQGLKPFVAEDLKVRDAVLESLSSDPSADVRKHAIAMLAPVQGDSSVRRVLHTVSTQDANPYIRTVSMQALGSVGDIQ